MCMLTIGSTLFGDGNRRRGKGRRLGRPLPHNEEATSPKSDQEKGYGYGSKGKGKASGEKGGRRKLDDGC